MDGAQALATGGNFYELRKWGDARMGRGPRRDQGAERTRISRRGGKAGASASTPTLARAVGVDADAPKPIRSFTLADFL